MPSTGSGTEQVLGQCLLNDWMLEETEMNKQGLDKNRDKPSPWLTDLGHNRGSNGAFWGLRRARSPSAGGLKKGAKMEGSRGRERRVKPNINIHSTNAF